MKILRTRKEGQYFRTRKDNILEQVHKTIKAQVGAFNKKKVLLLGASKNCEFQCRSMSKLENSSLYP